MDVFDSFLRFNTLHPEHEEVILKSEDDCVKRRLEQWRGYPNVSLSAWTLYMRQEKFNSGDSLYADILSIKTLTNIVYEYTIQYEFYDICHYECDQCKKMYKDELLESEREELLRKIYDIDMRSCESADPSNTRDEMALLNGFITPTNRDWIDSEDEYFLYDLSIDDVIIVQDQLITELMNANLYHSCRGVNMTLNLLNRDIAEKENAHWYMGSGFDDGRRGL